MTQIAENTWSLRCAGLGVTGIPVAGTEATAASNLSLFKAKTELFLAVFQAAVFLGEGHQLNESSRRDTLINLRILTS